MQIQEELEKLRNEFEEANRKYKKFRDDNILGHKTIDNEKLKILEQLENEKNKKLKKYKIYHREHN